MEEVYVFKKGVERMRGSEGHTFFGPKQPITISDKSNPNNTPLEEPSGVQGEKEKILEPSTVDLETHSVQPGLGPAHLEDLNVVKEFIGLKENIVLLDYPSPENPVIRYGGCHTHR